jgi:hypothetical protein
MPQTLEYSRLLLSDPLVQDRAVAFDHTIVRSTMCESKVLLRLDTLPQVRV